MMADLSQSLRWDGHSHTLSSWVFVCEAERQKRALASIRGVAGNPTTTVAKPSCTHLRLNALKTRRANMWYYEATDCLKFKFTNRKQEELLGIYGCKILNELDKRDVESLELEVAEIILKNFTFLNKAHFNLLTSSDINNIRNFFIQYLFKIRPAYYNH